MEESNMNKVRQFKIHLKNLRVVPILKRATFKILNIGINIHSH